MQKLVQTISWPYYVYLVVITGIAVYYGIQIFRKHTPLAGRRGVALVAIAQIAYLALVYGIWYRQLHLDPVRHQLLPPHSLYYLSHLQTAVTGLAMGWVAALLLFWFLHRFFIKRHGGVFIDGVDAGLLTLGAIITGWPTLFLFLAAVFVIAIVAMLILVIFRRKKMSDRLIITPYIIPAAVIVMVAADWLLKITGLWRIGF